MPRGVYKHIKGKRTNTGRTHFKKGQHPSPTTEFKKGKYQGYGFEKGQHPWNFQNYSSREPYGRGWTNILKESIRLRDNYKCQQCGIPQEECDRALDIHHKDEIKTNLNPNNLISLCRGCHTKETNYLLKQKSEIGDQ